MGYLIMNRKEREQAKVFEQVIQRQITQKEAAVRLGLTRRWVRAKLKRYRKDGDKALLHRSRGMSKPDTWDAQFGDFLADLFANDWYDFGPTYATKKLKQAYDITVSKETVRSVMIKRKLWFAKGKKRKHRAQRERREMFGQMIQLDGSFHDWFEDRGEKCTLLVFIDDATSKIVWLEFARREMVTSLMQSSKNYIETNGIPQSFYVDHGSVFHVNLNNKEHTKITQWERAMKELKVDVIHAHSPQAKGRVERCHGTLQDHLVKELRLAQVATIEQANTFLRTTDFIAQHNNEFSVDAAGIGDAHRDVQEYDLERIFSIQKTRVLANDYTIQCDNQIFQLAQHQPTIIRPKHKITVCRYLNGTTKLRIRKTNLNFEELTHRPKRKGPEPKPIKQYQPKPSRNSQRWVVGLWPTESRVKPAAPAEEAI